MKHYLNRVITYFSLLAIPIFLITSCTHLPARVNSNGLPQREYALDPVTELQVYRDRLARLSNCDCSNTAQPLDC